VGAGTRATGWWSAEHLDKPNPCYMGATWGIREHTRENTRKGEVVSESGYEGEMLSQGNYMSQVLIS
jgi:hypothetical protein